MAIEKKPFRDYTISEDKKKTKHKIVTIWLNEDEQEQLKQAMILLQQPKEGTALKQMAKIGYILLGEPKTNKIMEIVFKNKLNNTRLGIVDFD